jgi:hypothetical protein
MRFLLSIALLPDVPTAAAAGPPPETTAGMNPE